MYSSLSIKKPYLVSRLGYSGKETEYGVIIKLVCYTFVIGLPTGEDITLFEAMIFHILLTLT